MGPNLERLPYQGITPFALWRLNNRHAARQLCANHDPKPFGTASRAAKLLQSMVWQRAWSRARSDRKIPGMDLRPASRRMLFKAKAPDDAGALAFSMAEENQYLTIST
jgi:hypothetical protein